MRNSVSLNSFFSFRPLALFCLDPGQVIMIFWYKGSEEVVKLAMLADFLLNKFGGRVWSSFESLRTPELVKLLLFWWVWCVSGIFAKEPFHYPLDFRA